MSCDRKCSGPLYPQIVAQERTESQVDRVTQESHQARRLAHMERWRLPAQPQSCLRIGLGGGGWNVRGPRDYVE